MAKFEFSVIQNTGVLKVSGNFQVAQLAGRENIFFPTKSTENQKKVKRGTSKYTIFSSTKEDTYRQGIDYKAINLSNPSVFKSPMSVQLKKY